MGAWSYLIKNTSGDPDFSWTDDCILRFSKYSIPLAWTCMYTSQQFYTRTTEWDIYDTLLSSNNDAIIMLKSRQGLIERIINRSIEKTMKEFYTSIDDWEDFQIMLDIGELESESDAGVGKELLASIRAWKEQRDDDLEIALRMAGFRFNKREKRAILPNEISEEDLSRMIVGLPFKEAQ